MRSCKAVFRLHRIRLSRIRKRAVDNFPISDVRGFFNWKYSGALIFFFYALAVAMISIGLAVEPFEELFNFAYLFFILSFSLGRRMVAHV